jgi:predicted phosphatase
MTVIKVESTIFFDVDDTLIMWVKTENFDLREKVSIKSPYDDTINHVFKHKGHIKILKDKKARGSLIVVWSAGGFAWAEAVVKALELENYVDFCMTKPSSYVDDKQAQEIMGERIYLPFGGPYGQ